MRKLQGPIGPPGFNRSQGPIGPHGPPGFNGTEGPRGIMGPQGLNGSQEVQVPTGPQGSQGAGDFSKCEYKNISIKGSRHVMNVNIHTGLPDIIVEQKSVSILDAVK